MYWKYLTKNGYGFIWLWISPVMLFKPE